MHKTIKELQDLIRQLRDSESHVCPHSKWTAKHSAHPLSVHVAPDEPDCTCEGYDDVIDLLSALEEKYLLIPKKP